MNGGFEDREKAFEDKWAHDQQLRFKVMARRAKLVGLWAAREMGVSGAAAEAYAVELVKADMAENGAEDIFRKVSHDFAAKGVTRSDHFIRSKMDELLAVAKKEVLHDLK